jgi:8-oxo-dGTP diphosphatase
MAYTPVVATLAYVLSPDGREALLIRRNRRHDDPHFGKCNGLGGKLEAGEDVISGLRREVREESGLECDAFQLRGTVSWPGFGVHGEDWLGFIFLVSRWHGTLRRDNAEGELFWHPLDRILELPLWEGDRFFLPMVFDRSHPQFHGVMPYRDGKPVSWSYSLVNASFDGAADGTD